MATRYTTWGPVRQCCGHRHRTMRTALACIDKDADACKATCGNTAYSDRMVRELHPDYDDVDCYDVTRGPGRPVRRKPIDDEPEPDPNLEARGERYDRIMAKRAARETAREAKWQAEHERAYEAARQAAKENE